MKKIILRALFMAVLIVSACGLSAQDSSVRFGIKAGANLADMTGDINDNDPIIRPSIGMVLDFPLSSSLYLKTGLDLSWKGTTYEVMVNNNGYYVEQSHFYEPLYMQMPVHLGYKLNVSDNFSFTPHFGPYLAYGVAGKYRIESLVYQDDDKTGEIFSTGRLKEFDFGFGAGLEMAWKKCFVNIGYDFGMINIKDKIDNEKVKLRNTTFNLSLGYKF